MTDDQFEKIFSLLTTMTIFIILIWLLTLVIMLKQ